MTSRTVHGVAPDHLIEKIIRERISESLYYKANCYLSTAATLLDHGAILYSIGGLAMHQKPSEFLCLALRLLRLQPEREIINEYIQQEDFK